MNIYPAARDALLRGDIDFDFDTFRATTTAEPYDPTDVHVTDVTTTAFAVDLAISGVADGQVSAEAVTFPTLTGPTVVALVVFQVPSNLLIAYISRRIDAVPISVMPDGGAVTFEFPDYLVKL